MDQSSVRKFICLVILSHEENILADFYMCFNHALGSEESTSIYTNLLFVKSAIIQDQTTGTWHTQSGHITFYLLHGLRHRLNYAKFEIIAPRI